MFVNVHAQTENTEETTEEPKTEKEKTTVSEEKKEKVNKAKDRFVFNINTSILLHEDDNGFSRKGFAGGFDTYFMYDVVIKESPVSIAPGIGIGIDNYRTNSEIQFTDSSTLLLLLFAGSPLRCFFRLYP